MQPNLATVIPLDPLNYLTRQTAFFRPVKLLIGSITSALTVWKSVQLSVRFYRWFCDLRKIALHTCQHYLVNDARYLKFKVAIVSRHLIVRRPMIISLSCAQENSKLLWLNALIAVQISINLVKYYLNFVQTRNQKHRIDIDENEICQEQQLQHAYPAIRQMCDAPDGTGFQGSSIRSRYLKWPPSQPSLAFIHQALVGRIILCSVG